MSKKVSAFLLSHGSIDANHISTQIDRVTKVNIYDYSVDCQDLPEHTRLCMPNILGKPYYANQGHTIGFINRKMTEWNSRSSASSASSATSFSDFIIAGALTQFEKDEVTAMFVLQEECDRIDTPVYVREVKMMPEDKAKRRAFAKATIQKHGIKWNELQCYIPEKKYNLITRPDKQVLVVIENPGDGGVTTVSDIIKPTGLISGRMNLAGVNDALRNALRTSWGLGDTDEICFFDFACNTFNFIGPSDIDQYSPKLLSYQHNPDVGATIIYGTITKYQCKQMERAEVDGITGVSIGDEPRSQLTVGYQSDWSSQDDDSQISVAASAPPLLHVRVPLGACFAINFGSDVFGAGLASGGVAAGDGSQGGKRKYTKRKRNLRRSYRKRRVTRRRYNLRRFTKKNHVF